MLSLALLVSLALPPLQAPSATPKPTVVTTKTRDGITLTAELLRAPEPAAEPASGASAAEGEQPAGAARSGTPETPAPWGVLVCLHSALSSRGEYLGLAPELAREGLDVLMVDLRSGGNKYGRKNAAAADFEAQHGRRATPEEAYEDVLTAARWARELAPGRKLVLCGSSYSASLALLAAAKDEQLADAVLAFSPGEYFSTLRIAESLGTLAVPAYVTCGSDAKEQSYARTIAAAIPAPMLTQWLPPRGLEAWHGAMTLAVPDETSRKAHWTKLRAFLALVRDAQAR